MTEPKRKRGRPRKTHPELVEVPKGFDEDPELGLTEMQAAFVWHYTEFDRDWETRVSRVAVFYTP